MSEPNVPRSEMPQIDEKDIARLIVYVAKAGYGLGAGEISPHTFIPHQAIDWAKVKAMPDKLLVKPVICTKKFEIIDGNHRVAKHLMADTPVPYIMFDMSFVEALDLLAVFPFAYEIEPTTPERN
jgi:hypothetical protein